MYHILLAIFLIYTSYLLLFKKSYNLLAGMTEDELKNIQENLEVRLKYDKGLKILGYISFLGGIVVLVLGLSYLFK